jgi:hypothetical protein
MVSPHVSRIKKKATSEQTASQKYEPITPKNSRNPSLLPNKFPATEKVAEAEAEAEAETETETETDLLYPARRTVLPLADLTDFHHPLLPF